MNNETVYQPGSPIPEDKRSSLWDKLLFFGGGVMLGMTLLAGMSIMKERLLGPKEYIPGDTRQNLLLLQKNFATLDFALMFIRHEEGELPPAVEEGNVLQAMTASGYGVESTGLFFPRQADDPFRNPVAPLRYAPRGDDAYVLVSNGPDGDADVDERSPIETGSRYDPTNGLLSNGDIVFLRQGDETTSFGWTAESLP